MRKVITRWVDPIILIGLFISLSISVGMVLLKNDTIYGFIVGLLSVTITLIVEVISKVHKAEDSILRATKLTKEFTNGVFGNVLSEILLNYETIRNLHFDHYNFLADSALNETVTRLREIASGSVIVETRSIYSYGLLGIPASIEEMLTIHLHHMEFWNSTFGQKYLKLNLEAIKRGVKITRLFALNSDEVNSNIEILKQQEKMGIKVFVIEANLINNEFVIFDKRVLVDFDINKGTEYNVLERIIVNENQVKKKNDEYRQLILRYGKPLKEIINLK